MISYLDDLNVEQLIALIFLVDQDLTGKQVDERIHDPDFLALWRDDRDRLRQLIEYYPSSDEERLYLIGTLEAVHQIYPYADDTRLLRDVLMPYIDFLTSS